MSHSPYGPCFPVLSGLTCTLKLKLLCCRLNMGPFCIIPHGSTNQDCWWELPTTKIWEVIGPFMAHYWRKNNSWLWQSGFLKVFFLFFFFFLAFSELENVSLANILIWSLLFVWCSASTLISASPVLAAWRKLPGVFFYSAGHSTVLLGHIHKALAFIILKETS